MMNAKLERKELFCALVDVLNVAISHQMLGDAESVLQALRAMKPRMVELDTFEAWIAMRRGYLQDAIRLLRHVDNRSKNALSPFAKALLAFCLYSVGDPTWKMNAQQVIDDDENAAATGLVRLLFPDRMAEAEAQASSDSAPREAPAVPVQAAGSAAVAMAGFLRA